MDLSISQKKLLKLAGDFHLDDGVSLPIFTLGKTINCALLTCVPDVSQINIHAYYENFKKIEDTILGIAYTYNFLVKDFHIHQSRIDFNPLSPREKECLEWVAKGKTDYEIGIILGNISKLTVRNIIEKIKEKMNCNNRTSAVVQAMQNNYIKVAF
jgi:DNA-binding CsgD family transcriptional regulator